MCHHLAEALSRPTYKTAGVEIVSHSLFHVLHLTLHVVLLSSEKLNFIQQFAEVLLANFGLFTLHNGHLRLTHVIITVFDFS